MGVWCISCAYYVTDMLFKFTIMNLISVDLSSDFRGLGWKCTCMNHISCNFHATHPHMIYVIHSISICDPCLGLVTLNVTKIPLVHCWSDDGRDWWECLGMIASSWAHKVIIHNIQLIHILSKWEIVRSNLYKVDIVMNYCGLAIILIPLSDSIMFNLGITTFVYVCGG